MTAKLIKSLSVERYKELFNNRSNSEGKIISIDGSQDRVTKGMLIYDDYTIYIEEISGDSRFLTKLEDEENKVIVDLLRILENERNVENHDMEIILKMRSGSPDEGKTFTYEIEASETKSGEKEELEFIYLGNYRMFYKIR